MCDLRLFKNNRIAFTNPIGVYAELDVAAQSVETPLLNMLGGQILNTQNINTAQINGSTFTGASAPFPDSGPLVENSADHTKTATLSCASITTGNDRILTIPDTNGNIVVDTAEALKITNTQTTGYILTAAGSGAATWQAGSGLTIMSGIATLSSGSSSVTITNSSVQLTSKIIACYQSITTAINTSTQGDLYVSGIVASTQFSISSNKAGDGNSIYWIMIV